jgi:hypothetical protein
VVLNMARAGADLAGVAGFHASLGLNTPAPAPGTVKAEILVLNGADDLFVKKEQYATFKADLDAVKAAAPVPFRVNRALLRRRVKRGTRAEVLVRAERDARD